MKKTIAMLALLLLGMPATELSAQSTRKAERDAERARIKAEENADAMEAYQLAIIALRDSSFVLEANQAIMPNGLTRYVDSDTNFVMVNGTEGTVQTSSNSGFSGPNGIGGVTLNGTVSAIEMHEDKHHNLYYSFAIQGVAISAQVFITLTAGSSSASATVYPNFSSNQITFNGNLVPYNQSQIFMGSGI